MVDRVELVNDIASVSQSAMRDIFVPLVKAWWWAPWPFILLPKIFNKKDGVWLLWRQTQHRKKREFILLEFILPGDIIKPVKAMEDVFAALYVLAFEYMTDFKRELWIDGASTKYSTISVEIVGKDGKIHYYMRIEPHMKDQVSSIVHAQFPNVEIREAPDYTGMVPKDLPSAEWKMEGREFTLGKDTHYPLKTYMDFFESGREAKEEKRITPMARLVESFSRLKEGEQLWIQFNLTHDGDDWKKEAQKDIAKIAKRPVDEDAPLRNMIKDIATFILVGWHPEEAKEEEKLSNPELMLTPGERHTVEAIERKISKNAFKVSSRFLYVGKEEVFFKPRLGFPFAFTNSLSNAGQYLGVIGATNTKVVTLTKWFDKANAFIRKRNLLDVYKLRVNSSFPGTDHTFILNVEELATIFHFPGQDMAPGPSLERLDYKKGSPPSSLPIEEV